MIPGYHVWKPALAIFDQEPWHWQRNSCLPVTCSLEMLLREMNCYCVFGPDLSRNEICDTQVCLLGRNEGICITSTRVGVPLCKLCGK